ncbi:TetR/AcrR family transcriptional regulator [Leucobacter weissii]|uniref:TetR/AcrR family transcriptional regulator n=1 Tax=Leucobacter weissii TaxID=1983706 RepID=A0A939MQS4_9MICO|nr:TetR/AcrR family transcriptional regulator [Leucobacter weissii]MBO1901309.1 TetR/AcrR family transcriptional regulator [Leucobacter weissii]
MSPATAPRGRPRSAERRVAVLRAASSLFQEVGAAQTSIDAIAARARVAKQTVYRWWPSKAAVLAECAVEGYLTLPSFHAPATGDPRADLTAWLEESYDALETPRFLELFRALNEASGSDPVIAAQLDRVFARQLRQAIRGMLDAAFDAGALRPGIDLDVVTQLLIAHVSAAVTQRADRGDIPALVAVLLHGIGAGPRSRGAPMDTEEPR